MEKTCFKCNEHLPLSDFYRHKVNADGHLNKCKQCTKQDTKRRYYGKHEEVRAYERKRFKEPKRRVKSYAWAKRHNELNPEKYKARTALHNAIRDGKLVRGPCEKCGSTDKIHGHHHDYSKPLDVHWLCSLCHGKEHRKN